MTDSYLTCEPVIAKIKKTNKTSKKKIQSQSTTQYLIEYANNFILSEIKW